MYRGDKMYIPIFSFYNWVTWVYLGIVAIINSCCYLQVLTEKKIDV